MEHYFHGTGWLNQLGQKMVVIELDQIVKRRQRCFGKRYAVVEVVIDSKKVAIFEAGVSIGTMITKLAIVQLDAEADSVEKWLLRFALV